MFSVRPSQLSVTSGPLVLEGRRGGGAAVLETAVQKQTDESDPFISKRWW